MTQKGEGKTKGTQDVRKRRPGEEIEEYTRWPKFNITEQDQTERWRKRGYTPPVDEKGQEIRRSNYKQFGEATWKRDGDKAERAQEQLDLE